VTLIFCFRHDWVGNVGKYALLLRSGVNPIMIPINLVLL